MCTITSLGILESQECMVGLCVQEYIELEVASGDTDTMYA